MISRAAMAETVSGYDDPGIAVLGSHSALEIMDGAKDEGFRTTVYCQRGRHLPYQRLSRIADSVVILEKFSDMAGADHQARIREAQNIVVPHRSLAVYLGYDALENDFCASHIRQPWDYSGPRSAPRSAGSTLC